MNFRTASVVLRYLARLQKRTPAVRVAARWLWASMKDEYDVFMRLQVLEGSAGVPEGTWWKKGKAGLPLASKHYEGFTVDKEWFSSGNTGMVTVLEGIINKFINRQRVPIEPSDIMNTILMGIGSTGSVKKKFYEVGEVPSVKNRIQSGKEKPQTLAKGMLGVWISRKLFNVVRDMRFEDVGGEEDIGHTQTLEEGLEAPSEHSPAEALVGVIFDRSSRLGEEVRDLMRRVWSSPSKTPMYREFMTKWLDYLEKGKLSDPESKKELIEIAREVGAATDYHTKYWKPAWNDFIRALWNDKGLLNELHKNFTEEGVGWFSQMPDLSKIGSAPRQNS